MDTSKQYIEMCDCPEIQDLAPNSPWSHHEFWNYRFTYTKKIKDDNTIWLPRQDQLQGMLNGTWDEVFERFAQEVGFHGFNYTYEIMSDYELSGDYVKFGSMEQLWLAFYMREAHNKVWDGSEWNELV